jgi:phosphoribosylformylglycinamidine synthase
MYDTCAALRDVLIALGVGIDGGNDSLSMAAVVGHKTVKAPGNVSPTLPSLLLQIVEFLITDLPILVLLQVTVTAYCTVPDITKTVTPDTKSPDGSVLIYVDLGGGKTRLGATALAQVGYRSCGSRDRTWSVL